MNAHKVKIACLINPSKDHAKRTRRYIRGYLVKHTSGTIVCIRFGRLWYSILRSSGKALPDSSFSTLKAAESFATRIYKDAYNRNRQVAGVLFNSKYFPEEAFNTLYDAQIYSRHLYNES